MVTTTLMTAATMSPGGNLVVNQGGLRRTIGLASAFAVLAALASAQVTPRPTAAVPSARAAAVAPANSATPVTPGATANPVATATPAVNARQSSLTVQQIVARQEAHFGLIQNCQGIAVHSESKLNAQGQPAETNTQYIYFAFAGDKSVTLAMPAAAAKVYGSSQGQVPWPDITAATLINGDTVYSIQKPLPNASSRTTTGPTVIAVPYNPAVHENNPLVAFHPRQVGDEQLPLRELARAIPQMAQRPMVTDVSAAGRPLLQIDFANPGTPGEHLYYLIDPQRGYLPVKITRMSHGKPLSVSDILLAPTPEGYWMPARRERVTYDASGKPATRQSWHYEFVAVNKGLAPMALTLMYFNLPLTTQVKVVEPTAPAATPRSGSAPVRPAPAAGTPRPSPTPAPTPMRVRL